MRRYDRNCLMIGITGLGLFVAGIFVACSINGPYLGPGVCRHKAVVASMIAEELGYQTRIRFGVVKPEFMQKGSEFHVQAEALINGEWIPPGVTDFSVYTTDLDTHYIPVDPDKSKIDVQWLLPKGLKKCD